MKRTAEEILKKFGNWAENGLAEWNKDCIINAMEEYAQESKVCSCGGQKKLTVTHCADCGGIMDIADVINNHIRFKIYIAVDDEKKTFQFIDKNVIALMSKKIRVCVRNKKEQSEVIHDFENAGYTQIK